MGRVTPEILAMPKQERLEYIKKHLIVTSDKPFEPGQFDKKAPITTGESAAVIAFFGVLMGGPIAMILAILYASFKGSWARLFGVLGTSIVLALHPMPDPKKMTTINFTISLYKYFSYRWMWVDDVAEKCDALKGWVGAGGPHGVLPLANVLSMPAINAFTNNRFIGAGASVVLWTPFLRYITLLGGACDVSAKSLTRETIKPSKVEDNPPQSAVDETHELLLARITEVFDSHKAACGWGDRTMKFV